MARVCSRVRTRAYIFIDTNAGNWAVEIGNALELEANGWNFNQVRAGDTVTVEGNPAIGQSKILFAKSVALTRTGQKLFAITRRPSTPAATPAPRWTDGRVRLGPAVGQKGYWGTVSTPSLFDSSAAPIPMELRVKV